MPLNNNNKNSYSVYNKINNYPHLNDIIERNKIINNCKMINSKNVPQGEISKKILLTEEVIYKNKMNEENKNIKKEGNEEENYKNKKYTKIINNGNGNSNSQISKRISDKNFKSKNYYGYDEVNNIEGAINNHSYFESVYSKKGQQKNISIDKNKQLVC